MPRPAIKHDNTEVQQLLMQFDMETKYDSLPSWMQDSLIAACRCNLTATEDLPTEGSTFFIFKTLKEMEEITTSSVSDYLKLKGMGYSLTNSKRWAERFRCASKAIEFHGERNFISLKGKETDIYIDVDNCFSEFPDDPANPAPNFGGSESPLTHVGFIKQEPLADVLKDIESRESGVPEEIQPIDRHVWNLKNGWNDGFLANAFKHIIKDGDVIVDTNTGEVLEWV